MRCTKPKKSIKTDAATPVVVEEADSNHINEKGGKTRSESNNKVRSPELTEHLKYALNNFVPLTESKHSVSYFGFLFIQVADCKIMLNRRWFMYCST